MSDPETKHEFNRGIEECMNSLYGTALRLTGNAADAEDLVAGSVTKAWSADVTLEDRSRIRARVLRILHNRFISDYRKQTVRPKECSYEENYDDEDYDLPMYLANQSDDYLKWWGNPEREFVNHLLGKEIMSALDALPETFRITVCLVNVEGLSYDEAAEVLDVPPGTVRSRMKRGRTLLQKALWQHARDAGLVDEKDTVA